MAAMFPSGTLLDTQTVGSTAYTVSFTMPADMTPYTHLRITAQARTTRSSNSWVVVFLNGVTTQSYYAMYQDAWNDTNVGVGPVLPCYGMYMCIVPGTNLASQICGVGEMFIPCFRNTTFYKTGLVLTGECGNGAGKSYMQNNVTTFPSTAAITSITLSLHPLDVGGSVGIAAGSVFQLYGIP